MLSKISASVRIFTISCKDIYYEEKNLISFSTEDSHRCEKQLMGEILTVYQACAWPFKISGICIQ